MAEQEIKELKNIPGAAKENPQELERYVREFSNFIPLPVCTVNPLGIVIDVNKALLRLTGFKETEIIGRKTETLFKDRSRFRKLEDTIMHRGKGVLEEMTLIAKGGAEIAVRVDGAARKDENGDFAGYFIAASDISKFKKLQESLEVRVSQRTKESEKKARALSRSRKALMNILEDVEEARKEAEQERDKTLAIIRSFPDGLLFFDSQGRLSRINPRIREIFDIGFKPFIGKTFAQLKKDKSLKPLMDVIGDQRKKVHRKELELQKNLVVEVSKIEVARGDENIGTLITVRDVTREKLIEKMKTEFVSITAHQLRTPLSAIKWTISMILDGDVGEITQEQRELLGKTYQSNERMIRLINDLLNVSRIEEGRFLYKMEKRDFVKLVEQVVASLKNSAQRKGIEFQSAFPRGRLPLVTIDSEKLSLVVQNLVENAINYTRRGKVNVSVEFQKNKRQYLFKVSDNGIGIPKKEQNRIFSKFFRAAEAMKMETKGTGLGLFIAKNIIEAHKGRIWFESKEGEGSTFYFTIPVIKSRRIV